MTIEKPTFPMFYSPGIPIYSTNAIAIGDTLVVDGGSWYMHPITITYTFRGGYKALIAAHGIDKGVEYSCQIALKIISNRIGRIK